MDFEKASGIFFVTMAIGLLALFATIIIVAIIVALRVS